MMPVLRYQTKKKKNRAPALCVSEINFMQISLPSRIFFFCELSAIFVQLSDRLGSALCIPYDNYGAFIQIEHFLFS